jgi:putative DNA primase/helicase
MYHERTVNAAKGKWKGILLNLGMPEKSLNGKHGPCPLCNSKDNFRFDNKEGRGSFICTCQAGDGMALAMAYTGKAFSEVAASIDQIIGNLRIFRNGRPQSQGT